MASISGRGSFTATWCLRLSPLLFFLVFFLNFWVASRFLGRAPLKEKKPASWAHIRYQRLLEIFRQRAFTFYLLFSLIIAVFVAFPLYQHWEDALLYVFAPPAGLRDPVYGKDVSYYLFSLPIYQFLLQELLVAVVFMFLGPALLYWRESRSPCRSGAAPALGGQNSPQWVDLPRPFS